MNMSTTSTKKRPAITSMGIAKLARSTSRYSVPKKTTCGASRWPPTSMLKPAKLR
jgi:hypothetical protein